MAWVDRLRHVLRGIVLLGGLALLLPPWLATVNWGQEEVALHLLPHFAGPTVAVGLLVGKVLLAMLLGAICLGFGMLLVKLRSELITAGFEAPTWAKVTALVMVSVGIVCLEPYPLYLRSNGRLSFDIARNLFVSLPPVLRSVGLVMLLIGMGEQGRRRLSSVWEAIFLRLAALPLKRSLWAVGMAGFICSFLMGELAFHRLPSLRDEVAALFQAGIFARGAFVLQTPPWAEFMDVSCIITTPAWSSMYPPGWAMFLAIGTRVGAPWLIGFCMAAFCCVMMYLLLRREAHGEAAWLGVLLLLSSPFFLRLAASYMSHVSALALTTAFLYLSLDPTKYRSLAWGLLAGLTLALAMIVRPLPVICTALPVGLVLLKRLFSDGRQIVRFLLPASCAVALVMLAWMAYNAQTTGFWYQTGYYARLGEIGEMGFGARIMGQHTLLLGALHNVGRLFRLSEQGIGIPFTGALLLGVGVWLTPWNTNRRVLFAGFLLVWATSGLYWWYEHWFGPRYILEGLPGLLVVTSLGLVRLLRTPRFAPWIKAGLAVGFAWAFAALLPAEVLNLRAGYGEVDRHTVAQLREPELADAVVIIEDSDMNAWPHDTYTSAFLAMVLDEFKGAIMVRDLGEKNRELRDLLNPIRWFYYSHGDRTGEGCLEVIHGPIDQPLRRAGRGAAHGGSDADR